MTRVDGRSRDARVIDPQNLVSSAPMSELVAHLASLDRTPLELPRGTGTYRAYADVIDALSRLDARPIRIGTSVEDAPLFAFDVGPHDAAKVSFVVAGLHAMEWIGVEAALDLLTRLTRRPPSDRLVRVVPVANVDGYRRVEAGLRRGERRFDRANARGVDLNRNWPTHWSGTHLRAKVLPHVGGGGVAPQSEPEIAAILESLDALGRSIDRALSLHSFGRKVLYPYGGVWRRPSDHAAHVRAAEALARDLPGYDVTQAARWVPGAFAPGMELDHLHDRYGALALLMELGAGGFRIRDRATWLTPFRWFNAPAKDLELSAVGPGIERFVRGEA